MGWSAVELADSPSKDGLPDVTWTWIHTGSVWVALPPAVYALWIHSRQHPVSWPRIAQALGCASMAEATATLNPWWRHHVWLAWPWAHNPYGGFGDADWITLATIGDSPDPVIPDVVWAAHPSLGRLQRTYQERRKVLPSQAQRWAEAFVPFVLRNGLGHLVYGRATLPRERGA